VVRAAANVEQLRGAKKDIEELIRVRKLRLCNVCYAGNVYGFTHMNMGQMCADCSELQGDPPVVAAVAAPLLVFNCQ
jgi:hypothetical protein